MVRFLVFFALLTVACGDTPSGSVDASASVKDAGADFASDAQADADSSDLHDLAVDFAL
ncbi:MAG: hypothetical protein ABI445_21870 [Polyangia bacterium]